MDAAVVVTSHCWLPYNPHILMTAVTPFQSWALITWGPTIKLPPAFFERKMTIVPDP
jgi:hypothetical protein